MYKLYNIVIYNLCISVLPTVVPPEYNPQPSTSSTAMSPSHVSVPINQGYYLNFIFK